MSEKNKIPEFEDNAVGKLKKEIWLAGNKEIDKILKEYNIPSLGEMDKPGSYIQTTPRAIQEKKKEKNDIVLIPLGSTENHGPHCVSGQDILQVTRLCEAIRRYTAKQDKEINLAWPPLMYGYHPKHHMGMPGTIPVGPTAFEETIIDVMFGLWMDGYRKQVIVSNHGHHWQIVSAIHKFAERYPEISSLAVYMDWITAISEFFQEIKHGGPFEEPTIHAGEFETSIALLLIPEMVEMKYAIDTKSKGYLPEGHFDKACNQYRRPMLWYDHQGNVPLEVVITPEGTIGSATKATAQKAKKAVAATLRYLTLLCNDILEKFPAGTIPPIDEATLFSKEEVEGYCKKPDEPGYKNPYRIWRPR